MQRPEDHRRKWDVEEYEKKTEKRNLDEDEDEDEEEEVPVKRELLKARDYKVWLKNKN